MKFGFLPSTRSDLLWTRAYYAHIFPDGAKRAAEQYRRTSTFIRNNPLVGRPVEEMEGVREYSILCTPLSFIYRVVGERIEILRVWGQRGDRSSVL